MNARDAIGYIAATLVVAAAVHLGTVWYLPNIIMDRAMTQMGAVNTIHHGQRATAAIHGVVRPSPDLLYSVCPYDLSKGPLFISAPVPPGTYWSVSLFDDATNNFYALNDRQAGGVDRIMLAVFDGEGNGPKKGGIVLQSDPSQPLVIPRVVFSPTTRGLAVFRTLISDESKLADVDAVRRKANCVAK